VGFLLGAAPLGRLRRWSSLPRSGAAGKNPSGAHRAARRTKPRRARGLPGLPVRR